MSSSRALPPFSRTLRRSSQGWLSSGRSSLSLARSLHLPAHRCVPPHVSALGLVGASRSCSSDAPAAGAAPPAASPKVAELVEQIASLSLLEAAELTEALKERLGITSAMMMPAGGGGGGGGGGAAAAEAEEEVVVEKTHFTVRLEAFDSGSKIKLIKEVRAYTGLGLKDAKELVEKAPAEIKADVPKEEAEALKEKLEGVGGTVVLD